jgi:amino acid adenylation domain-containing protein
MLSDAQRAGLAARLRRGRAEVTGGIPRRPAGRPDAPLSYGQEQLWFVDRFAPGEPTYNIPLALGLSGALDAAALHRALGALVTRHEALRTRLVTGAEGHPVQVVDPPRRPALPLTDWSGLASDARRERLLAFIDAEAVAPFDLSAGPLLRTFLLRLDAAEHVLLVVVHHTVFDGWSAGVLLRELAALYGQAGDLPELPVQFADYALWERDRLQGPALAELADYWRGALEGFETLQFPTDRPRPVLDNFDGELAQHLAGRELLDDLRDVSRQAGTTLFVTLMAGLAALLHRYTGQTDVVVGTVSANRTRPELESLIGFLVNTLPIRADLSGDPTFAELLAQVKAATVGAYGHQDLPFGKLVETLGVDRDASRAPVFQVALTYAERDPTPACAAGVEFTLTDLVVGIKAAKFDLGLLAEARADGLWFECSYKTALFDAATVRRLLGHLEVLLRGVAAGPAARLSELPLLTDAELHQELAEWNDTAAVVPPGCVHQLFEAAAAAAPGAVAAEYGDESVSYAELDRQADRIALRLRELGVGPESLVGVCMPAGLRRLAAFLGIWKAGGGYVPLDPGLPAERLSFMVADTGMAVVLTDDLSAGRVPPAAIVVNLDREWERISGLAGELGDVGVTPANAAYVIYTSGSTGQPKGVVVEHRHAVNFLHGMVERWRIGGADAVLQFAAFTFDVSVLDMYLPLVSGARLVLAPAATLHSPARLAALIRDRRVTFACLPPAVLALLAGQDFPHLRTLVSAGEELAPELARRWLRPGLRLVNGYGPTEATVLATCQELDASTVSPPPIGRPVWPNYRGYVLDAHLNPVPVGVTGELHIGGASVARGYLNRPELTRERFIGDPFVPGERLYKSGDLVRRRRDGAIVFLGRIDHQVKIRGLRIETGEIDTALAAHPAVAQAVTTVITDHAGEKQLAAYLRPEPGARPDPAALRAHLARSLPAYMIPAHLITVAEFPLNSSGKVDRAALPVPEPRPVAARHAEPATFTETVLVGLYATVLHREQVGATDGFFDAGGNSLQAMRLIDLISEATGVDVGVTTVFLHPTPRQLAASIDATRSGAAPAPGSDPLVELSAGVSEPPLFLVHPVGGTVFAYAPLARELAGAFRVYGLEAPGLRQPGATAVSLAGLADDYTARIRAAQPGGPYRLAGWSMGGVIAFEVARRLEEAGAEVALLALLDAPFAVPGSGSPAEPAVAGQFVADAALSLGWDPAQSPDPATSSAARQLEWLAGRLGIDDQAGALRSRFDVFAAHSGMLAGYRPAGPSVRAPTLIVSADDSPNAPAAARWPQVLDGPVSALRVAGDHYTFLRPPLLAEVARSILKEATVSTDLRIEAVAREGLTRVLDSDTPPHLEPRLQPADLDPDLDLADGYGLTSLNKVLFLMSVCDDTQVSLASFTEPDVAAMRTLRDVVTALAKYASTAA